MTPLIDKSVLTLSEPRRYRDPAHLEFVSSQPCLLCGRRPSDAHHLRFAQPRALGRRVSDEFAVPLCRTHHRVLHNRGDEAEWWKSVNLDPVVVAAVGADTPERGSRPSEDRHNASRYNRIDGSGSRDSEWRPTCRWNQL